jgi:hypothetical protein
MAGGQVVYPLGATEITAPVDVDEYRGTLASRYPHADTSTDAFYPLPCEPSLGGEIPAAANAGLSAAEQAATDYVTAYENSPAVTTMIKAGSQIGSHLPSDLPRLPEFQIGGCDIVSNSRMIINPSGVPCDDPRFLIAGQPFEGRDIIYVHGLAMGQLGKWLANYPPAHRKWPASAPEFLSLNGYFRVYARNYWKDHIREHLRNPVNQFDPNGGYDFPPNQAAGTYTPKSNRYLVIAWSSNQTMEYAQHALLTQIMLAMTQNLNVETPESYPKEFQKPFCANGCILISHSTGPEIVSSAMGRAARGDFGLSAKAIPAHMRAHISMDGAISGSRLASAAMAVGLSNAPSSTANSALCPVEKFLFDTSNVCSLSTAFVAHTILRDLMPGVAQGVWGPAIAQSPVPTVTIAGGHPSGNQFGVTKFLPPGVDDGVISMNSACGNPWQVKPGPRPPSGSTMKSMVKSYDMGIASIRAIKNFISQKDFQAPPPFHPYLAAACTPHLSTTGMVMPVLNALANTLFDAHRRYPNYFSFIQGSNDHAHEGGGDPSNPWPSASSQSAVHARVYRESYGATNAEETSAITDARIYARAADGTYLVHPAFSGQMGEYVRGRKVTFKLLGKKRTWWIWKRTYHLLNHWKEKSGTSFAYEYVARR